METDFSHETFGFSARNPLRSTSNGKRFTREKFWHHISFHDIRQSTTELCAEKKCSSIRKNLLQLDAPTLQAIRSIVYQDLHRLNWFVVVFADDVAVMWLLLWPTTSFSGMVCVLQKIKRTFSICKLLFPLNPINVVTKNDQCMWIELSWKY